MFLDSETEGSHHALLEAFIGQLFPNTFHSVSDKLSVSTLTFASQENVLEEKGKSPVFPSTTTMEVWGTHFGVET